VRLDEALDDRREINIEGHVFKADPEWFVVASINPLSHTGTKELPPQILSRFGARFKFAYPDLYQELQIIQAHLGVIPDESIDRVQTAISIINSFRSKYVDLPYRPSIRESLTAAKLILTGYDLERALELTVLNTYAQFSEVDEQEAKNLLQSMLRKPKEETE